jgi:rhodanese-related sulfurtransferase
MQEHSNRFLSLVRAAKHNIEEVDINYVKQRLDAKQAFYLIDVREDNEWVEGHLPTAIHISKGIIERDIEKHIPDVNADLILYCGGGHRSALATDSLRKMGYMRAHSMDGGFRAWVKAGYPIQRTME